MSTQASDAGGGGSQPKHYAVVPARGGSKGVPNKNRYFFNYNADFLESCHVFDGILVTSDDEQILAWAEARGHFTRLRPDTLADDTARIKQAIVDMIENAPHLKPDNYLWLTYNTQLHKDAAEFRAARDLINDKRPAAFCTFIDVQTHPYITWYPDPKTGKMKQFIPNDVANRQDMPEAWMNYMHIVGFQPQAVERLNSNLLGEDTYPIFLSEEQQAALCDLDLPEDIVTWRCKHPDEFRRWRETLPPELDLTPLAPFTGDEG